MRQTTLLAAMMLNSQTPLQQRPTNRQYNAVFKPQAITDKQRKLFSEPVTISKRQKAKRRENS